MDFDKPVKTNPPGKTMQTFLTLYSAWQQLRNGQITCEEALKILVDEERIVNLDQLDPEVNSRFFRGVTNRRDLPPVIPLLLWCSCYYLGSPVSLKRGNQKTERSHIPIALRGRMSTPQNLC